MKPNSQQIPGIFDEIIVLNQLKSSETIAYHNFMKLGYPIKVGIAEIMHKLKPILEPQQISFGEINCCRAFLLANGFMPEDFKFSETEVQIRPGKLHLMNFMNDELEQSKNAVAVRFREEFIAFIDACKFPLNYTKIININIKTQ